MDCSVRGSGAVPGATIRFLAARPGDRRASFTGSMLPFPSHAFAFTGTPNCGAVTVGPDGTFAIDMRFPNSYYDEKGRLVPPHVDLTGADGVARRMYLGRPAAARLLHHPDDRLGPSFYDIRNQAITGQYQRFLTTVYPQPDR